MRKLFFLIIAFISCYTTNSLYSQTERGRLIYGGGGSLQISPGSASEGFLATPQFGGFPAKNFAIIGLVNVNSSTGLFYGLGPEFRYYIGGEKVKFFAFANVAAGGLYYGSVSGSRAGIYSAGGPGIAVFAGPNFAIHASLYCGFNKNFETSNTSVFVGLGTTFNGLFTPKKKE